MNKKISIEIKNNNDINNTEYPFIKMKDSELYFIEELNMGRIELKPEIPRIGFFVTKDEKDELLNYQLITGDLLTITIRKKFVDTIYKFKQFLKRL
ncbi:hypothetical protein MC378_04660 [Polaribacter sp. MSW13]|uniref:Uncharacterized protein n=1 Tax=Polaribacter marinus TaxID=2916838 RepID=A0A9X2AM12_9FLAO|nr:hypothetical protein [Polaribacter marinus]MCI2228449.1 hypothetical protein [Polaribacter marinus]